MPPVSTNAEVSAIDTQARWPLLLLLAGALKWLVLASVLALVASIQLHSPAFLAECPVFTHGRMVAMAETAFIYGWAANAGLGLALWILGRLGGEPLRGLNWVLIGTFAWNLGLALGLIGIAIGDATSVSLLQLPHYVQPLMLVAYGAIAVSGILAWLGRRTDGTYAAQWYAVAALFLFPWLFSAAQVMLLFSPVRGALQAVASGWFAQGAWTLWLAPLGLAGAYYVVPKITGRVLPSYDFAPHAFWCLLVLGAFTGGRHLIGGPVPAWIPSVAIVSCALLFFHYAVVFLNLRGAIGAGGTALRLIAFGLVAYVLGGLVDAISAFRVVAVVTQFTYFDIAQQQLALYGGFSTLVFGAIYFAVPRLTGRPWASIGLVRGHGLATMIGIVLLVVSLAAAGWVQGHDLLAPKVTFADISAHTRGWLLVATAAQGVLLLGNLLLLVNFVLSVGAAGFARPLLRAETVFLQPTTMESSVS